MQASRYNQIFRLDDQQYLLLNLLSGSVDVATSAEMEWLERLATGHADAPAGLADYLRERGYLYEDQEEEEKALAQAFAGFQRAYQQSPTQVFLVPTYSCNLNCNYCFQQGLTRRGGSIRPAVLEAFFTHLAARFSGSEPRPYVTLFGGEPLLPGAKQRTVVRDVIFGCRGGGYELAVVTNGYHLLDYLDLLAEAPLKEVQVTLDGPPAVHDARRPRRDGGPTFARIWQGLREAVEREVPVNLRVVVDRENLAALVDLAALVEEEGWLELPAARFKTQVGRRYQLNPACGGGEEILSRAELWAAVGRLAREHPVLERFHRPDFYGLGRLAAGGELPPPVFDSCPATKREWAYDLHGDIYGCTATVGRREHLLGHFYPRVEYDGRAIGPWQRRNVLAIPSCSACPLAPACGGGCGAVAAGRHGSVLAPDCRPVREMLELGVRFYRERLLELSREGEVVI